MSYNLRIIQEYFQPKIGRRIRIFSLGRKNNILIKKKRVYRVTGKLFAMKRFMKNKNSQRFDNALQATFEMKRFVRK